MHRELKRITRRQWSLVTRGQLLSLGISERMIDYWLETGVLERVIRGVYRAGGAPRSWRQDVLAACLAAGPGTVASHRTAAALYGLTKPGAIEISVPLGRGSRSSLATVHRARDLSAGDLTVVERIPITRPARR